MQGPLISVVIPVYKGEHHLEDLVGQLITECSKISKNFEIVLVDDCGPDRSWDKIIEQCELDARIKGVLLSRNFGQHQAITAGLDFSKGEWVIVMDCDLQDQPSEIHKLYQKSTQGFDVVFAARHHRQDSFIKILFSKYFYKALSYFTGTVIDPSIANFGIYNRKVIDAIIVMRENIRFFPMLVKWVGFKTSTVPIEHAARSKGKSTYSLKSLLNLALNIMLAFSDKPLRLMVKTGLVISAFSFFFAIYSIIRYFIGAISVSGFTSLIVSIWFICGITISSIGVAGLYVGKIFEQTKQRPIYIVNKTENINIK